MSKVLGEQLAKAAAEVDASVGALSQAEAGLPTADARLSRKRPSAHPHSSQHHLQRPTCLHASPCMLTRQTRGCR